jgi:hypothetical protein
LQGLPEAVEVFNMKRTMSSESLKPSTLRPINRGTSPRVSAVLQKLGEKAGNQVELARKAEINRGVLNQLWLGKTKSTPKLIGRLCAVLNRESARRVLKAFLEEVAADVRAEQLQVESENAARPQLGQRPAIISVTYTPQDLQLYRGAAFPGGRQGEIVKAKELVYGRTSKNGCKS